MVDVRMGEILPSSNLGPDPCHTFLPRNHSPPWIFLGTREKQPTTSHMAFIETHRTEFHEAIALPPINSRNLAFGLWWKTMFLLKGLHVTSSSGCELGGQKKVKSGKGPRLTWAKDQGNGSPSSPTRSTRGKPIGRAIETWVALSLSF